MRELSPAASGRCSESLVSSSSSKAKATKATKANLRLPSSPGEPRELNDDSLDELLSGDLPPLDASNSEIPKLPKLGGPHQERNTRPGNPRPPKAGSQQGSRAHELPTMLSTPGQPMPVPQGDTDSVLEALSGARSDAQRLRLVAGRMIPGTRYRIIRWLGEGGMGVVYEVENIDIEKNFALKVLRFDLSQQEHIARIFRDEARAASRIGSPYIVDINNFGELSDGRLFFCMEMLEGHDLTPDTESPTLPVPEFLGYLRQICKGLGAAHNAGIIHRDIKPENIFVYTLENRKRIKLLDFGISAMCGGQDASGGTPHYMAPEQILSMPFDGRLDIYALGCTAFELLTGQPPFDHEDVEQLFSLHLEKEPPRFSEINPEHEIPEVLEAVILRCLAKRPEDRYENMAELEVALCEAQIAADIATPWDDLQLPEIDPERAAALAERMPSANRYRGRRRWLWPSIALFSSALAVGLAFALSERPATDQEKEIIDSLVARAQNAGARTWYVYPPEDKPAEETSYLAVLELENLQGPMEHLGREAANNLRQQFANTLTQVGDRYWEVPGARMFARDFYTQAVFFDPNAQVASTRSGVTPGQLIELKQQAKKRTFSPGLLASLQLVNDMADPNLARRDEKLKRRRRTRSKASIGHGLVEQAITASQKVKRIPKAPIFSNHPSVLTPAQLAAAEERALRQRIPTPAKARSETKVGVESPKVDPKVIDGPIEASGRKRAARDRAPNQERPIRSRRDLKKSTDYLKQAQADRRKGRRSSAERLYNLSLAHNSRNHRALHGLSELYFELGNYEKSVKHAQSAVRYAPNNRWYQLQYGDALFKVHRYLEARKAYERASKLGARGVAKRLRKIAAKIGAPR